MNFQRQLVGTKRARQRGSSLVELAICLLGFMLLTMGAMDYGWAVYAYNFCAYAAQDAARWASVHGSQSASPASEADVQSYVSNEAIGLTASQLTVTACWAGVCPSDAAWTGTPTGAPPSGDNDPGSTVSVTVQYTIHPLSGMAIKQNLTVGSTAQFVVNH